MDHPKILHVRLAFTIIWEELSKHFSATFLEDSALPLAQKTTTGVELSSGSSAARASILRRTRHNVR
jgi:hypothetical protein